MSVSDSIQSTRHIKCNSANGMIKETFVLCCVLRWKTFPFPAACLGGGEVYPNCVSGPTHNTPPLSSNQNEGRQTSAASSLKAAYRALWGYFSSNASLPCTVMICCYFELLTSWTFLLHVWTWTFGIFLAFWWILMKNADLYKKLLRNKKYMQYINIHNKCFNRLNNVIVL